MAAKEESKSTQSTQYDKIGTKYNTIKVLPATEPEEPSVIKALGYLEGKRCLGTYLLSHLPHGHQISLRAAFPLHYPHHHLSFLANFTNNFLTQILPAALEKQHTSSPAWAPPPSSATTSRHP